jgi:hypothetical protein
MGGLKHGYARKETPSATYRTWLSIHHRCKDTRGVVKRWEQFEHFLEDLGEKPDDEHELVRLSTKKPWGPSTAKWVTKAQARRMRSNVTWVKYRGQDKPVGEWAELYGIPARTIRMRLERGWSVGEALRTPTS